MSCVHEAWNHKNISYENPKKAERQKKYFDFVLFCYIYDLFHFKIQIMKKKNKVNNLWQ